MTAITVHVEGLPEALDLGFSVREYFTDHEAELTTDHPSSSHGLPVLVKSGVAYGPADLSGVTVVLFVGDPSHAAMVDPARSAGWHVREYTS